MERYPGARNRAGSKYSPIAYGGYSTTADVPTPPCRRPGAVARPRRADHLFLLRCRVGLAVGAVVTRARARSLGLRSRPLVRVGARSVRLGAPHQRNAEVDAPRRGDGRLRRVYLRTVHAPPTRCLAHFARDRQPAPQL